MIIPWIEEFNLQFVTVKNGNGGISILEEDY
jgi:hypothetical protein